MNTVVSNPVRPFHESDESHRKRNESALNKAIESGLITTRDVQLIREYIAERKSTNQISASRSSKILYHLIGWRRFLGPYADNTIYDLFEGIEKLKEFRDKKGLPFKQNTKRDYISILKNFCLWLIDNEYSSLPLKKVEAIRVIPRDQMTVTQEQLITDEEIERMLTASRSSRDRALLATLYDGAFRAQEIGVLKWGDVSFTEWNVKINTNEKTGKPRCVVLTMARPYLAEWKANYPEEPSPDKFVFVTRFGSNLRYGGVCKVLQELASRAELKKHVRPHLFRHSRITRLLQKGYPEAIVKRMAWGNQGTAQINTYAHLTDVDVEREFATREGIKLKSPEIDKKILEPRQCGRCLAINAPTDKFCRTCGLPLTEDLLLELETVKKEIHESEEYKKLLSDLQSRLERIESRLS